MQAFLVLVTFLVACGYLGKKFYQTFLGKEEHCEGCAASPMHHKSPQNPKRLTQKG